MDCTLSIVVTTHNRASKLRRMIDSALKQTHRADEIVIINDGSTTNYSDVRQWALTHSQILWMDIENAGVSAARNRGVLKATSPFIVFCDDDDYFLPNHIEHLRIRIKAENNKKGIYHTHRIELRNDLTSEPPMNRKSKDKTWQEHYITEGEMIPSCTCMHREVALQFPFPVGVKYAEDHEQRLLAMSAYPCFPIYERTVVMDRTDETATNRPIHQISGIYRKRFHTMFKNPKIKNHIRQKHRQQVLFRWTSLELSEIRQNRRTAFPIIWLRVIPRIKSISNLKTWLLQGLWFLQQD